MISWVLSIHEFLLSVSIRKVTINRSIYPKSGIEFRKKFIPFFNYCYIRAKGMRRLCKLDFPKVVGQITNIVASVLRVLTFFSFPLSFFIRRQSYFKVRVN